MAIRKGNNIGTKDRGIIRRAGENDEVENLRVGDGWRDWWLEEENTQMMPNSKGINLLVVVVVGFPLCSRHQKEHCVLRWVGSKRRRGRELQSFPLPATTVPTTTTTITTTTTTYYDYYYHYYYY